MMEAANEGDQGRGEANPTKQMPRSEKAEALGREGSRKPSLSGGHDRFSLRGPTDSGQMLTNPSLLLGLPENMTPTGTCGECMEALDPKHLYSPIAAVCCSLSPHITGNCSLSQSRL